MSSDLVQALGKVPILQGQSNYREWSIEVKATARFAGVWPAIQGTDAAISKEAADVAAFATREDKAIGLICRTVSSHLKIELDELRIPDTASPPAYHEATAKELWDHLKTKFEKKDGVSAIIDYGRLTRTKLVDDGTLEEQLNALQDLRSRCALNDFKYDDWQFAALILLALPDSYENVKEHFLTTPDPKNLKPDDIRARILEKQNRKKDEADVAGANIILTKHATAKNKKRGKRPPDDKPCFNCGKKGHWARECKSKKKDTPTSSNAGPGKPGGSSLNVVENSDAESDSPVLCYFGAPENWLMDSGATDHMTPYGSDFTSYAKFNESRTVILGDGSTRLNIIGKGNVERWVETSPHVYREFILQDVLHVEGIKRRFLSMGRLDTKGFSVTLSNARLTISKGKFTFYGFKTGPLFNCTFYAEKPLGDRSLNSVEALPIKVWHDRMGHLNWEAIKSTRSDNPPLIGVKLDASDPPHGTCPGCAEGKAKRRMFKSAGSRTTRSTRPLERIHSDLAGPMEVTSISGDSYICVFTCDCTSFAWVYRLKSKDQTLDTFKRFVTMIEKLTGYEIQFFHSDRGGEFMSNEFTKFLEEKGITRETSAPRTPQQNGVAERMNQTLIGGARALIHHSGMSKGFWSEAMNVAVHVINRAPRKSLGWRTPYELLFGRTPEVSYLRVFGCRAWVFNDTGKKWDPKSNPMIFVGYEAGAKAYRLWNPATRSIVVSANVRFSEHEFPYRPAVLPSPTPASVDSTPVASSSRNRLSPMECQLPSSFFDEVPKPRSKPAPLIKPPVPPIPPVPPVPPITAIQPTPSTSTQPSSSTLNPPRPATPESEPSTPSAPRKSGRKRKPVEKFIAGSSGLELAETEGDIKKLDQAYLEAVELYISANSSNEPRTYREAMDAPDAAQWDHAMAEEFKSLEQHGTWERVPRPENRRVVSSKWVYRVKYDADGNISRYKARLVARGFTQVYSVDYTETFAPVTRLETLRLLFALAVQKDWEVRQINVKTAYLYGDLDEEVYMEPPEGVENPDGHVYLLRKAIYGLKQAGRQWYRKLKDTMSEFGLTQVISEPHTFVAHKVVDGQKCTIILPIYVDDLFPIGDKRLTDDFETWIGDYFKITTPCDAHYFLGIRIKRNRNLGPDSALDAYISLDQDKYIESVLSRVTEPIREYETPLSSSTELVPNPEPRENADQEVVHRYQSAIGQLMYIMLGTRPDLAYAVGKLSRFSSNPSPNHTQAVLRVFGYLLRYPASSLVYQRDSNDPPLPIYGYTDADWAGETDTAKSTSGYVFFLSNAAFSWSSKKQEVVAGSTMEAEYIALYHSSLQSAWIGGFMEQIGFPLNEPLEINCDNEAAIAVANGGELPFKRSKHINVKYQKTREYVNTNQISVVKVTSEDNLADQFTKVLTVDRFNAQSDALGFEPSENV